MSNSKVDISSLSRADQVNHCKEKLTKIAEILGLKCHIRDSDCSYYIGVEFHHESGYQIVANYDYRTLKLSFNVGWNIGKENCVWDKFAQYVKGQQNIYQYEYILDRDYCFPEMNATANKSVEVLAKEIKRKMLDEATISDYKKLIDRALSDHTREHRAIDRLTHLASMIESDRAIHINTRDSNFSDTGLKVKSFNGNQFGIEIDNLSESKIIEILALINRLKIGS
jgi:hypothetical protein